MAKPANKHTTKLFDTAGDDTGGSVTATATSQSAVHHDHNAKEDFDYPGQERDVQISPGKPPCQADRHRTQVRSGTKVSWLVNRFKARSPLADQHL